MKLGKLDSLREDGRGTYHVSLELSSYSPLSSESSALITNHVEGLHLEFAGKNAGKHTMPDSTSGWRLLFMLPKDWITCTFNSKQLLAPRRFLLLSVGDMFWTLNC